MTDHSSPGSATPMQRLLAAAGWDAGSARHKQLEEALVGAGLALVETDRRAPAQAAPQECRRLIKRIDELLHPDGFDPKEAHRELHELAHEFEKLCTQPQGAQPTREQIARIIDPVGMSDGIRLRWALEKADAIISLSRPQQD